VAEDLPLLFLLLKISAISAIRGFRCLFFLFGCGFAALWLRSFVLGKGKRQLENHFTNATINANQEVHCRLPRAERACA
jgi:hypothetical protein